MRFFVYLVFLNLTLPAFTQQSVYLESNEYLYAEALSHYQASAYKAGLDQFDEYLKTRGTHQQEAQYYRSMCLLKSGSKYGEEALSDFVATNPGHPLASRAYFSLGNFYFARNDYAKADKYYGLTDQQSLNTEEKSEYFFKQGYCLFTSRQNDNAIVDFNRSISFGNSYKNSSAYYLGYIYYHQQKFAEALSWLNKVDEEKTYLPSRQELTASIYYQRKDDKHLVEYSNEIYSGASGETQKTLNRMLGETYFELGKYTPAVRYLQAYLEQSNNRMDEAGYFKLALSHFKLDNTEQAIANFKLAALGKGDLVQVSSFYLGQLYLKTDNKEFAVRSFEKATNGEDPSIKEESTFLLGKINYQRGQFSESIEALSRFSEQYPSSKFKAEVTQLLAQAFLKTSNYDQAIKYLESIKNKSEELNRAYQTAAFHKGQLLFNDSKFAESIVYLNKSVGVPVNREMAAKAYYLLGEGYSLQNKNREAISSYQQCKRLSSARDIWNINSDYGLGYIYYNNKEFDTAEDFFTSFTGRSGNYHDFYLDGMMRLADCKYVLKKYSEAIRLYDNLTRQPSVPQDYLLFQLALTYQLNNQSKQARATFERVLNFENSPYKDNALFQISISLLEDNMFKEAITYLDRFERDLPNSALMPYVRIKRALCYYNLNDLRTSARDYEYILTHYTSHPVANDALLGLQALQKKGLSIPDFDRYMVAYQNANPDDTSLEAIAFEAAKTNYYNQEYQQAIASLKAFQEKYPSSSFNEDVLYFLGDSYYRLEEWRRAVEVFTTLSRNTTSAYLSRTLDKRGRALIRLKEYQQALYNYYQLSSQSTSNKDQYLADEGRLLSHFQLGNYDSAMSYSNKILSSEWKPVGAEAQALLIQGKIYINKKEYENARKVLQQVLDGTKSEFAAESKYWLAHILYEEGKYKTSVETLFQLNEEFSSYDYWIGKSFILIADNYLKMNELFQSRATLNSIISKSPVQSIVAEAKEKLSKIDAESEQVLSNDSTSNEK